MRHGVQGLHCTSLCSFHPANVPPSAFLFTLEVSRVFIYSRISLCKSTFHKSQSFSSVSEQEAEQDTYIYFVTSKWLFFFYRSPSSKGRFSFCRLQEPVSLSLHLSLPQVYLISALFINHWFLQSRVFPALRGQHLPTLIRFRCLYSH